MKAIKFVKYFLIGFLGVDIAKMLISNNCKALLIMCGILVVFIIADDIIHSCYLRKKK